jgi:hypothetical protein
LTEFFSVIEILLFIPVIETAIVEADVGGTQIGNEVFEHLPSESARQAYAQWIGSMSQWATINASQHPVIYADNAQLTALPYLKEHTPQLTIYTINNYQWNSSTELISEINNLTSQWPGIQILLHEWGSDSFNVNAYTEDQPAQAQQIAHLAQEIETAAQTIPDIFIGTYLFEFTDEWTKINNPETQDPDPGQPWTCNTCFDHQANEDYWGIYQKPAYEALKNIWSPNN